VSRSGEAAINVMKQGSAQGPEGGPLLLLSVTSSGSGSLKADDALEAQEGPNSAQAHALAARCTAGSAVVKRKAM
jgi:hypothetical protein